jgi:hypothetical protein
MPRSVSRQDTGDAVEADAARRSSGAGRQARAGIVWPDDAMVGAGSAAGRSRGAVPRPLRPGRAVGCERLNRTGVASFSRTLIAITSLSRRFWLERLFDFISQLRAIAKTPSELFRAAVRQG